MFQRKLRQRAVASSSTGPGGIQAAGNGTKPSGTLASVELKNLTISNWFLLRISFTVLTFLAVHIVGIYLFTSGFLLSRLELDNKSTCSSYASSFLPQASSSSPGSTAPNVTGCWHSPRFKRIVFTVIDALRFDFTVYNETLADLSKTNPSLTPYYINKLPIFHEMLTQEPHNSMLFRVRADAPTTTMQRIKALTTGTLPTFVDAGNNFGGTLIAEDNILDQMVSLGKKVVFMGDDTWLGLFPSQMNASYPYPSFNVQDLHTVDEGCVKHLFPTLEGQENPEWDFLIAHFLGVDHAGHTYGPSTIPMAEKLTQVNGWLGQLFEKVDEETLVIVIGDHGMDPKGDHGGDSEQEVNAGLFVYSKKRLTDSDAVSKQEIDEILKSLDELETESNEPFVFLDGFRTTPQIDLVPTIALLMGIPIPFGNLGTVIPELFFVSDEHGGVERNNVHNLLEVTRLNAKQMHRYLLEYSGKRVGGDFSLAKLSQLFNDAESSYEQFVKSPSSKKAALSAQDIKAVKTIYVQYVKFMRQSLQAARKIWARFDLPLIVMGTAVLILSIICSILSLSTFWTIPASTSKFAYTLTGAGAIAGMILASLTGVVKSLISMLPFDGDSVMTLWHETLFLGSTFSMLGYLIWFAWHNTSQASKSELLSTTTSDQPQLPSSALVSHPFLTWGLGILLLVLHAAIPASDSFTIHEENAVLYFLQLFGLYAFAVSFAAKNDDSRGKLLFYSISFMILNRITATSTICREEKYQWCRPTYYFMPNSSVAGPWSVLGLIFIIPVVVSMMRSMLQKTESFFSTGSFIIGICVPVGLVVSAIYWTLDTLEGHQIFGSSGTKAQETIGAIKMWWAKMLFMALGTVSFYVWGSEPSCLGMREESIKVMDADAPATKHIAVGPFLPGQRPQPPPQRREVRLTIFGTGNSIGSSYFVFVCVLYMVLGMLQKPTGGVMLGIGMMQIMIVLDMLSIWRDEAMCDLVPGMMTPPASSGAGNTGGSEFRRAKIAMAAKTALQAKVSGSSVASTTTTTSNNNPKTIIPSPLGHDADPALLFLFTVVLLLLGHLHYFATGHQTTLSSIQYNAGFIGLKSVNWVLSPLMVLFNTYGAHILFIAAVPLLGIWNRPLVKTTEQRTVKELGYVILAAVVIWASVGSISTLFAGHFRRHLMVWRVFAPKFIFESVGMILMETMLGGAVMGGLYVAIAKYREVLDILESKKFI
jgi:phosphatidylinositol glycan class O